MKTIKEVTMCPFKGFTGGVHVSPLTLLVGANGTGKSRVLQAIRYAVTGETEIGAQHAAAMSYGDGVSVETGIVVQEGERAETIRRRVFADDGKYTGSVDYSAARGRSGKRDIEEAIRRDLGDFATAFDLGAFAEMSPESARAFVMGLCGRAGGLEAVTFDSLIAAVPKYDTDGYCDMMKAAFVLRPLRGDRLIEKAAEFFKDRQLEARRRKASNEKATRALSARKAATRCVATSVEELTRQRDSHAEAIAHARESLAVRASSADLAEKTRGDLAKLESEIAELQLSIARLESTDQSVLKNDVTVLTACVEALTITAKSPPPSREMVEHHERAVVDADRELSIAQANARNAATFLAESTDDVESYRTQLADMANDPWNRAAVLWDKIKESSIGEIGGGCDGYTEQLDALIEENRPHAIEVSKMLAEAEQRHETRIEEETAAQREQAHRAKRRDEAAAGLAQARDEYNSACDDRAVVTRDLFDAKNRLHESRVRLDGMTTALESTRADLAKKQSDHADKEADLASLLDSSGGNVDESVFTAQIERNEAAKADLEAQITARTEWNTIEKEEANIRAEGAKAEEEEALCKEMLEAVRAVRNAAIGRMLEPMIESTAKFFTGAGMTAAAEFVLIDALDKPTFDFGLRFSEDGRPSEYRSFSTMSGGERALFMAALCYAMLVAAGQPLKLMLLEASECDPTTTEALLNGCAAVAGDVSNVIIAHWNAPESTNTPWHFILATHDGYKSFRPVFVAPCN